MKLPDELVGIDDLILGEVQLRDGSAVVIAKKGRLCLGEVAQSTFGSAPARGIQIGNVCGADLHVFL